MGASSREIEQFSMAEFTKSHYGNPISWNRLWDLEKEIDAEVAENALRGVNLPKQDEPSMDMEI